MSLLKISAL